MTGHVEKRAPSATCILNGIKRSYDARFKLMVISYAKITDGCSATGKFSVVEINIQRWR
jgi:hypothetical protein